MIAYSSVDRDALIRTVFGEARGEPKEGQAAVAHVAVTRAGYEPPAWWGKTLSAVCLAPYQFSCWLAGADRNHIDDLCSTDDGYQVIATVVDGVLNGLLPDPTNGATHYKVTGTKASWDASCERLGLVPTIIGRHSFYKLGPHA